MNKYLDWKRILFASIPLWVLGYALMSIGGLTPNFLAIFDSFILNLAFYSVYYMSIPLSAPLSMLGLWGLTGGFINGPSNIGIVVILLVYCLLLYLAYPSLGRFINYFKK